MARPPIPLLPRAARWSGVAVVIGVVTYFSLGSAPPQPPDPTPFWDKRLHFAAYAAVALSLAYATATWHEASSRRTAVVLGGAVTVGAFVELLQGQLPYRYFGWGDMLANCLGATLGTLWLPVERQIQYVPVARLATRNRSD